MKATLINGERYHALFIGDERRFERGIAQDVSPEQAEHLANAMTHDPKGNVVPVFQITDDAQGETPAPAAATARSRRRGKDEGEAAAE